jgi:hypothetical protein
MMESQAEYFCQNVKYGCIRSVHGLGNTSKRDKWHLLECTLNSKLNTEIGRSASSFYDFDILPAHEELPAPIAHIRVREGIITVEFEELEVQLPALQAVPRLIFMKR